MRGFFLALAGLAIPLSAVGASSDIVVAEKGATKYRIVIPEAPEVYERTAAQELKDYIGKSTGAALEIKSEAEVGNGPAIYVGATKKAESAGLKPLEMAAEHWAMKTSGSDLILTGGKSRGTLYAVWKFLEDNLGVRWWTPYAETVPKHEVWTVKALDKQGDPAFKAREIYQTLTNDYPEWPLAGQWTARNRLNRNGSIQISAEWGGVYGYGKPHAVHTFEFYVPKTMFAEHPDWFPIVDGKRTEQYAQLDLLNPEVREYFKTQLIANIEDERRIAKETGMAQQTRFEISSNDWAGWDESEAAKAMYYDMETGESLAGKNLSSKEIQGMGVSKTDYMLNFVNFLADAVKDKYPEVQITTLAYVHTIHPPFNKENYPRKNVVMRFCTVGDFAYTNYLTPINFPEEKDTATPLREKFLAWADISNEMEIWDYLAVYRTGSLIPLPSVRKYRDDFLFFREHNVTGYLAQLIGQMPSFMHDMHFMKAWIVAKMLEDPTQDPIKLREEFLLGYYGPAGKFIDQYRRDTDALIANMEPNKIPKRSMLNSAIISTLGLLTPEWASSSNALMEQAEEAVKGDPELLARVKIARMGVDMAIITIKGMEAAKDNISSAAVPDAGAIMASKENTETHAAINGDGLDGAAALGRLQEAMLLAIDREASPFLQPGYQEKLKNMVANLNDYLKGGTMAGFYDFLIGPNWIQGTP